MNKSEFLSELRRRLSNLPQSEVERTISYFAEIIDDHIEDGMTENEAVSAMESIDTIVNELTPAARETRLTSYAASEISSIRIKDTNCPIILRCSGSDMVTLNYYDSNYKTYTVDYTNDGDLLVGYRITRKWYELFGFNFINKPFELGIPKAYSGTIALETDNGFITASDVSIGGKLSIKSSNGRIEMQNLSVAAALDVKTSNGRVYLDIVNATDITCHTSNGKIEAINTIAGNAVTLETNNNQIYVDKLFSGKIIRLHTSNGRIHGTINDNLRDFNVRSHTSNGSSTLPTRMDGGTKELNVHTSNGRIELRFLK